MLPGWIHDKHKQAQAYASFFQDINDLVCFVDINILYTDLAHAQLISGDHIQQYYWFSFNFHIDTP